MKKDIFIMVHEQNCGALYFKIAEGTGDNLLDEDIEEGYVDYIYYEMSELCVEDGEFTMHNDVDGGMVLCETMVADMSDEDIINAVLDMEFFKADGTPLRPHYEIIEEV